MDRDPRYAQGATICTRCGDPHAPALEAPGGAHAREQDCIAFLVRRVVVAKRAEARLAAAKGLLREAKGHVMVDGELDSLAEQAAIYDLRDRITAFLEDWTDD